MDLEPVWTAATGWLDSPDPVNRGLLVRIPPKPQPVKPTARDLAEGATDQPLKRIHDRVYACLPATRWQLCQITGLSSDSVVQALWRLMRAGLVEGPGRIGCSQNGVYRKVDPGAGEISSHGR